MNHENIIGFLPELHSELRIADEHDYSKLIFNYFADQVDNNLNNAMISELMVRYSDLSVQLDEKNRLLNDYNERLQELVQEQVKEISDSQVATIHALVKAAETRDDDTGSHIERTATYCRVIAENLREAGIYMSLIDDAFIENIAIASPLHDIGKIGIPDCILLKPGKLTDEEFVVMKTHAEMGYETLLSINSKYPENDFIKMGMEISRYHHEKWNGSGYNHSLSGDDIPLPARIMALSDVYDALRSKRVYKDPFSHEKSIGIISESSGSHFDPAITEVFLANDTLFADIFDRLTNN